MNLPSHHRKQRGEKQICERLHVSKQLFCQKTQPVSLRTVAPERDLGIESGTTNTFPGVSALFYCLAQENVWTLTSSLWTGSSHCAALPSSVAYSMYSTILCRKLKGSLNITGIVILDSSCKDKKKWQDQEQEAALETECVRSSRAERERMTHWQHFLQNFCSVETICRFDVQQVAKRTPFVLDLRSQKLRRKCLKFLSCDFLAPVLAFWLHHPTLPPLLETLLWQNFLLRPTPGFTKQHSNLKSALREPDLKKKLPDGR